MPQLHLSHLQDVLLWPGVAPGSEGLNFEERVVERSPEPEHFFDREVTQVRQPRLIPYLPKTPNGVSVILAPGGGYQRQAIDKEGDEIAIWLNGLGYTVFVLRYRLPAEGHLQGADVPLQDAQRALRLVRHHARVWGLRPDRIVAMGCSAGGHVMASLATGFGKWVYGLDDEIELASARPDGVVLMYPVISMDPQIAHAGSRESLIGKDATTAQEQAYSCDHQVSPATPPVFITLANDDAAVVPENSVRFYLALRKAGVSAEMHIFEAGGHGHSIRNAIGPVRQWMDLCAGWLAKMVPSA